MLGANRARQENRTFERCFQKCHCCYGGKDHIFINVLQPKPQRNSPLTATPAVEEEPAPGSHDAASGDSFTEACLTHGAAHSMSRLTEPTTTRPLQHEQNQTWGCLVLSAGDTVGQRSTLVMSQRHDPAFSGGNGWNREASGIFTRFTSHE